jgi:hypothetical protein
VKSRFACAIARNSVQLPSSFTAFLSPDHAISPHQSLWEGVMPAILFLVLLVGLWAVALTLFVWMHIPEPTIAEIMRAVESRS